MGKNTGYRIPAEIFGTWPSSGINLEFTCRAFHTCQRVPVNVVRRCPARNSYNVISRQVQGLPLDLILQDGVDAAVRDGLLPGVGQSHGPHEA